MRAAATLGNSFLQGKVKQEEVKESILRYPEKHHKAAIASFIKQITGEMNFENTPEILQAISHIIEDDASLDACKEAEKLFYQYMAQLKRKFFPAAGEHHKITAQKVGKGRNQGFRHRRFQHQKHKRVERNLRTVTKRIRSNY